MEFVAGQGMLIAIENKKVRERYLSYCPLYKVVSSSEAKEYAQYKKARICPGVAYDDYGFVSIKGTVRYIFAVEDFCVECMYDEIRVYNPDTKGINDVNYELRESIHYLILLDGKRIGRRMF